MLDQLLKRYPRLYHMAFSESYASILQHGLLSTKALLALSGMPLEQRNEILCARRAEPVHLAVPGGKVVIRDQGPISEKKLASCLEGGLTPQDWYERLNERVFFWVKEKRVRELLQAGAYASGRHSVLVFDTARLVTDHADNVELAPMNTGATRPMAFRRGPETFKKLDAYPYEARRNAGLEPVVEFTVLDGVVNAVDYLLTVEHWDDGDLVDVIGPPFKN